MKNPTVRLLITIFLLLMYINRGFFISDADEMNNPDGEINTVIEYVVQLITGEGNDIDEDGDMQTCCSFVKVAQHDFLQQLAKTIELVNLFPQELNKNVLLMNEELPQNVFYCQIDQPPEV
jgi:hypothetical protein